MGTQVIAKTRAIFVFHRYGGYGDLTLTDTALIWNKPAPSHLTFGAMAPDTMIPLESIMFFDKYTFFPGGGLRVVNEEGKAFKFSFKHKKDFNIIWNYLQKRENSSTMNSGDELKSTGSRNFGGTDSIKLWENCEEQKESFGDYLKKIDELLLEAIAAVVEYGQGSANLLQRKLGISYSRAARLLDIMEEYHLIGGFEGSKPRSVKITADQLEQVLKTFKFERKYRVYESETSNSPSELKNSTSVQNLALNFENRLAFLYAKFGYHSINGMDGRTFEKFCANLLELFGFQDVKITASSGDQGVDILALRGGVKYAIQCKSYTSPLGNTSIQEVHAGKTFYDCHVGVVMTNSTFTAGAIELAKKTGVLLWDGKYIEAMLEFIARELEKQTANE